ncbi:unnamed protein product, partial [Schistosoma mattheei]|uniref:RWD domain-containing protein n=1 Tax=Schistosoma mattheei TaxID=31246 RepID=A0AA85BMG9_9TREM
MNLSTDQPYDFTEAAEEIEVLSAIYEEDFFILEPENKVYEIRIDSKMGDTTSKEQIILKFQQVPGYPSINPVKYELHAPWLKCNILNELDKQLQLVVSSSLGSPVVYLLVETVRSFMCNYLSSSTENLTVHKVEESSSQSVPENHELPSAVVSVPSVKSHLDISPQILPFALNSKVPEIYHGEPLIDRKSIFQVSRWYGGIQLGPDRFKHINNVARLLLTEHKFLSNASDVSNNNGTGHQKKHKHDKRKRN